MIHSLLLAVTIVAHDPGYHTSLSKHIQRWLKDEQVAARVVTPTEMKTALANEKTAFLVGFNSLSAAELDVLKAYRARGGKLVVFHSASKALADLMGVQQAGSRFAAYPGEWSRMSFVTPAPTGFPDSILQTSTVLQRVRPVPGRGGRVLAVWRDRQGKSGGDAAWVVTPAGYWMTHVLLADGDEHLKAQLCGAIVGSVEPSKWNYAAHCARVKAKREELRDCASRQSPNPGEIHAVWDHSGCGLYPGNWRKTIGILRASGVTDLFVNVAGAGFAHYPSSVLPRSKTFEQEGDQMAACLAAAANAGVRVHAWVLCFTGTRATPDRMEVFRQRGWRLSGKNGARTEFLDPSIPAVRQLVLSAVDELQVRYPALSGIHLDFVRWGEGTVRPANAADVISQFVTAARARVKRPRWLTAAVYGRHPQCVTSVGQDWPGWLRANLVDYVVPMDYTESTMTFAELLLIQSFPRSHARRTIIGIGVTANESRLDAKQVIDQINLTRKFGFAGNALFDLDVTLEKQVLPYLQVGSWRNHK